MTRGLIYDLALLVNHSECDDLHLETTRRIFGDPDPAAMKRLRGLAQTAMFDEFYGCRWKARRFKAKRSWP